MRTALPNRAHQRRKALNSLMCLMMLWLSSMASACSTHTDLYFDGIYRKHKSFFFFIVNEKSINWSFAMFPQELFELVKLQCWSHHTLAWIFPQKIMVARKEKWRAWFLSLWSGVEHQNINLSIFLLCG